MRSRCCAKHKREQEQQQVQRTAGDEPKYGQQCEHRIHPAAPVRHSPRHDVLYARAPEQRPMAGRLWRVAA